MSRRRPTVALFGFVCSCISSGAPCARLRFPAHPRVAKRHAHAGTRDSGRPIGAGNRRPSVGGLGHRDARKPRTAHLLHRQRPRVYDIGDAVGNMEILHVLNATSLCQQKKMRK